MMTISLKLLMLLLNGIVCMFLAVYCTFRALDPEANPITKSSIVDILNWFTQTDNLTKNSVLLAVFLLCWLLHGAMMILPPCRFPHVVHLLPRLLGGPAVFLLGQRATASPAYSFERLRLYKGRMHAHSPLRQWILLEVIFGQLGAHQMAVFEANLSLFIRRAIRGFR